MDIRIRFARDILSLMLIPFLIFNQKNFLLSLSLFSLFQLTSIFVAKYPRKVQELIKLPQTLSFGCGLLQWLVLIENPFIFALSLMVLFYLLSYCREKERSFQADRLGPRYSHYDYWVGDFLPSWIPTSRLPVGSWQQPPPLIRLVNEFHNVVSGILLLVVGSLSLLRPAYSIYLQSIFGLVFLTCFFIKYKEIFSRIWLRNEI